MGHNRREGIGDWARVTPWNVLSEPTKRQTADRTIERKWNELGGSPGAPTTPGDRGLIVLGDNFYREYANGRIYYSYHYDEPLFVYGGIGERYTQLNGPAGWLGWPTSEEMDFPEGGRIRTFENGSIYWWPDTGPRDLNNVIVHYTGLHCFGEVDIDLLSSDDEPYATIGVIAPDETKGTFRSKKYEDVDKGESRHEVIEIYRGMPRGLVIHVVLQEHSGGDTELSRDLVKQIVDRGGTALAAAATLIPVFGPVAGPAASVAHQLLKDDITKALNTFVEETLGYADRPLGTDVLELTPKQMVVLATRPEGHSQFGPIPWRFETKLLSRFGASYKVYFNIFGA